MGFLLFPTCNLKTLRYAQVELWPSAFEAFCKRAILALCLSLAARAFHCGLYYLSGPSNCDQSSPDHIQTTGSKQASLFQIVQVGLPSKWIHLPVALCHNSSSNFPARIQPEIAHASVMLKNSQKLKGMQSSSQSFAVLESTQNRNTTTLSSSSHFFRRQSTAQDNKAESLVQDSPCSCLFLRVQCSVCLPYTAHQRVDHIFQHCPEATNQPQLFKVKPFRIAEGRSVELQSFNTKEILSNHVESKNC